MARTYFTLEYAGAEKTLAQWKLSQCRLSFLTLKASTFSCRETATAVDGGSQFAFEGRVILRAARTKSGSVFTGGAVVFVGYRLNAPASASALDQGFNLQFADAFYLLEDLMYRQTWYSGITTHVMIGMDADGNYVTTGEQLGDALSVAAAQGVPITAGTIETGLYVPMNERQSVTVAELVRMCARWSPDGVSWFDFVDDGETVTERLSFQRRGNLTAVSMPFSGSRALGTDITPRYDLKRDYCLLIFERTDSEDGGQVLKIATQIAPAGHPGTGRRGLVDTISLQGANGSRMFAEVETRDFDPGTVNEAATANDYWIANTPQLQNNRWRNAQVTFLGAKDAAGQEVDVSAYDYELVSGSLSSDMALADGSAVQFAKVRLWYRVSCDHYDGPTSGNTKIGEFTQELFIDRTLTNAPSDTYATGGDYEPGETLGQFAGMADYLLAATTELQYEGAHRFTLADGATRMNYVGTVLNLTGGDAAWTSMNALVTQCDVNLDTREVSVRVGPAAHLGKGDLLDLTRNLRERKHNTPKRTMTDGVTADAALQLPQQTAESGSQAQNPQYKELVIVDPETGAKTTITGGRVLLESADGRSLVDVKIGVDYDEAKIYLRGDDLGDKTARLVATDGCDGGTKVTKSVLREE